MLSIQGTWTTNLGTGKDPYFSIWVEPYELGYSAFRMHIDSIYPSTDLEMESIQQEDNKIAYRITLKEGMGFPLLTLINQLTIYKNKETDSIQMGESLTLWKAASQLVLDLLKSRHYIPFITANYRDKDKFHSNWDSLLEDPAVYSRIEGLLREYPADYQILIHFISTLVDRCVRDNINPDQKKQIMQKMNSRYIVPLKPTEHWVASLLNRSSTQDVSSLEWLYEDIQNWRSELLHNSSQSSYRTIFHLVEPQLTEYDKTTEPKWFIYFHLQSTVEYNRFIPAQEVWSEQQIQQKEIYQQGIILQEKLLKDLFKASRLCDPLKLCLRQATPVQCELTTEEAYHFLKTTSVFLKNEGFGVYIPDWWSKSKSSVGLKIKLKTKSLIKQSPNHLIQGSESRLGFGSLIDYEWRLSWGDEEITKEEFEHLVNLKRPLIHLKGKWVELSQALTSEILTLFQHQSTGSISIAEALQMAVTSTNSDDSGGLSTLTFSSLPIVEVNAEGEFNTFLDRIKDGGKIPDLEQPNMLLGKLRPYQIKGLSWLVGMREMSFGACLADDMGLGKTIQWIAYLLHLKQMNALEGPALLICPTSVLGNWQRELARFAPSLKIWLHYGVGRLSGGFINDQVFKCDIVLTSYATAQRDESFLAPVLWDVITLDEAQNIKNSHTKQTQSIRKFKAKHHIALTGTPVENRLSELWSILDFLNPGYLNSQDDFIRRFALPIERNQDPDITQKLHKIVQPFILRRVKTDRDVIRDLPDKLEIKVFCNLTKDQIALYEACVRDVVIKIEKAKGIERKGIILAALTHLKQICNHPDQFLGESLNIEGRSGKLTRLIEMLDEVMGLGERSLIFTQYAVMAELLKHNLEHHFGQKIYLMHGKVSKNKRDEMLQKFQNDPTSPKIFVLSLKTGGYGLNLTKANHVFHYDRWWNPAVENQATDRAYRIGQEKNVQVYKFICSGTLEEKIDQMIENKQSLATSVIGKGDGWLTEMTTDEIKHIFSLRNDLMLETED